MHEVLVAPQGADPGAKEAGVGAASSPQRTGPERKRRGYWPPPAWGLSSAWCCDKQPRCRNWLQTDEWRRKAPCG